MKPKEDGFPITSTDQLCKIQQLGIGTEALNIANETILRKFITKIIPLVFFIFSLHEIKHINLAIYLN